MNRAALADKTMEKLYGAAEFELARTDPDFYEIKKNLVYGEVYQHGKLDAKIRELINLVVAVTNQTMDEVTLHTKAALSAGLTPAEIKEAIYQCGAYIGLGKAQAALVKVNSVFKEENLKIPSESQKKVTEKSRLEDGLKVQKKIFGEAIDTMRASAPEGQRHIQDYLSAYCFGDFYTRNGLNLKLRELLTFCILCAQGGCENQIRAHISGNAAVGNNKEVLLEALTQCLPYIGFPRTLNALHSVNEILPPGQ